MSESFQDQLIRMTLEAAKAEIPGLVQGAMIQAQNMGFQTVQNVVRNLPRELVPTEVQDHIVAQLEQAKVDAPLPSATVEIATPTVPTKTDAAVRSWRTFVQALVGILVVAFGDELTKSFAPGSGFDMYALASWSNLLQVGLSAAVAAAIAFAMRYWTPKGT